MQPFDALTLKHFASELHSLLAGAKIHKVQQPTRHEFLISLWSSAGGRTRLYLCVNPQSPCCFILKASGQAAEQPVDFILPNLSKPTGFCMLLRKHMVGASISEVSVLPDERVLNIYLVHETELGHKRQDMLSLELMGRHSNLILVDVAQQQVLGSAHIVSEAMSRFREVAAGLPYIPPPLVEGKKSLSEMNEAALTQLLSALEPADYTEMLSQTFAGLGKQMVKNLLSALGSDDPAAMAAGILAAYRGDALAPGIQQNEKGDDTGFSLTIPTGQTDWIPVESVREMVATYYYRQLCLSRCANLQRDLLSRLTDLEGKRAVREQGLTRESEDDIQALRKQGDLILAAQSTGALPANPYAMDPETTKENTIALVNDYETGLDVELAIDPQLSWVENAQKYYQKAKKAKARMASYQEQLEKLSAQRDYYEELVQMIRQADTLSGLIHLEEDLVEAGLMKPRFEEPKKKGGAKKEVQVSGLQQFLSSDDITLIVGKTSQANGYLVGKLAKPQEIWLHVHQMPGSHVLIRAEREQLTEQTLWEAANLAVYFSAGRQSKNVPVDYTESRYVRKIPGSYPGHVTFQKEKTLNVTVDEPLVLRLLRSTSQV